METLFFLNLRDTKIILEARLRTNNNLLNQAFVVLILAQNGILKVDVARLIFRQLSADPIWQNILRNELVKDGQILAVKENLSKIHEKNLAERQ